MVVSFIGGGNRRTWRKPPTCSKILTNFITLCCTKQWENKIQDAETDVVFEMKLSKDKVQGHSRELKRGVHLHPGNINCSEVKDLKVHVKTGDKAYTTFEQKRKKVKRD